MFAPFHMLALGAIVLTGVDPTTGERTAKYRCEAGPSLSVVFQTNGAARVMLGGGAYLLKPAGADRWSDGMGQTLTISGESATWTSGVDGVRTCSEPED